MDKTNLLIMTVTLALTATLMIGGVVTAKDSGRDTQGDTRPAVTSQIERPAASSQTDRRSGDLMFVIE